MHLSHKILFGTVLAAVLIVAPLQQSYAQNDTSSSDDVASQISRLLELVASLQAQLAELQQGRHTVTTEPTPTTDRVCPVLSRTLYLGMQGSDVGELQKFLRSTGDYTYPEITKYFGPATQEAVQRWQGRKGIVSSGNPDTTGFGVVGPKTRNAFGCGGIVPSPRPIPSPVPCPLAPVRACESGTTMESLGTDANGCSRGYRCVVPGGNRPPVVNSFSGPTTLGVNQTGTWTIDASDPENGTLSYDLDWGDSGYEDSVIGQIYAIASSAFRQSNTFQHSYSRAGTYTVTVTVRDNAGNETRTTSTVRVGAEKPSDNVTFSASPTSGTAPLAVSFSARVQSSGGRYYISFGDGEESELPLPLADCGPVPCPSMLVEGDIGHTYTSPGTYTATLKRVVGAAEVYGGGDTNLYETLGTVTITVGGSTIDCNAIPSTLGPESLLWKEKCGSTYLPDEGIFTFTLSPDTVKRFQGVDAWTQMEADYYYVLYQEPSKALYEKSVRLDDIRGFTYDPRYEYVIKVERLRSSTRYGAFDVGWYDYAIVEKMLRGN